MALAHGIDSPRDMLAKAKRDLTRLENAEAAEDNVGISDALMDVAVALDSIRGWLKHHRERQVKAGHSCFSEVELKTLERTLELSSFTNIANEYKHAGADRNSLTDEVLLSAPSSSLAGSQHAPQPRVKVVRKDKSRHRATDLARRGINETEAFMSRHAVPWLFDHSLKNIRQR